MADELATRIRQARVDAGLTREQLAVTLGVSLSTVVRYETGRTVNITAKKLLAIGKATSRPLSYFLGSGAAT